MGTANTKTRQQQVPPTITESGISQSKARADIPSSRLVASFLPIVMDDKLVKVLLLLLKA